MSVAGHEHTSQEDLTPPVAAQRPWTRTHHGEDVADPYEWLRDGEDPEVIAHLEAENVYAEGTTAHLAPFVSGSSTRSRNAPSRPT